MIGIMLHLMKVLHYRIGLKTIPKRSTFRKQPLDKKLSLRSDTFKSIFIVKNTRICITHIVYLLFMLPLRMTNNHMCSVLLFLPFGMGRPKTPAASMIKPFVRKRNSWSHDKSILPIYLPTYLPTCLPTHHCYKVKI